MRGEGFGLCQRDGKRSYHTPFSRIVDTISEDRGCGGVAGDWDGE
ncbi:hypothetical protein TIFTF001_014158 [Ficus carica]|uniref:Uncharacterized protein n=1 Tax=Ficus carica TaxID=3494 RepID=A0AA87ZWA0_FICCA|nr:hypothetical protein TIFTF001_014158 [Ficus carica]